MKTFTELVASVSLYIDLLARHSAIPENIRSDVDAYIKVINTPAFKKAVRQARKLKKETA
jgi:hypothetical protein